MPTAAQDIFVLLLVVGACAFIGWQGYKTFTLRKGKLGACCSKGCDASSEPDKEAPAKAQFIPVEMLGRRR